MMLRFALAALVAAATLLAACGEESVAPPPAAPAEPAAAAADSAPAASARTGRRVRAFRSQFGTIVGDRRRLAFYFFDKEKRGRSECYGACARAWPPVLTKGRPVALAGIPQRLLGTTRRRGGARQVTYRGRPVYYYVADGPGRVLCHNVREFGGLWLVLRPNGAPVT